MSRGVSAAPLLTAADERSEARVYRRDGSPLDPPGARLARWRRRAPGIFVSFAGCSGGLALLRLRAVSYAVVIVPVVDSGTHRDPEVEHTGSRRAAAPDGAGAGRLEVERGAVERERRTGIDLRAVDDGTEIHGSQPGI